MYIYLPNHVSETRGGNDTEANNAGSNKCSSSAEKCCSGQDTKSPELVTYRGATYIVEEALDDKTDIVHDGSIIAFSKNGVWQGVAYENINRGRYYAAASIFTLPNQAAGASIQLIAGPKFEYGDKMHPSGYPKPRGGQ